MVAMSDDSEPGAIVGSTSAVSVIGGAGGPRELSTRSHTTQVAPLMVQPSMLRRSHPRRQGVGDDDVRCRREGGPSLRNSMRGTRPRAAADTAAGPDFVTARSATGGPARGVHERWRCCRRPRRSRAPRRRSVAVLVSVPVKPGSVANVIVPLTDSPTANRAIVHTNASVTSVECRQATSRHRAGRGDPPARVVPGGSGSTNVPLIASEGRRWPRRCDTSPAVRDTGR